MDAPSRVACIDAGSETGTRAPRRMFKDEQPWDATTVTRNSGHNELWIDADWLLGRRITPRTSYQRSRSLLAAAVLLFCIGPAMQAMKKPSRREGAKMALPKLPSASMAGPVRHLDSRGIPGNQLEAARATAITSTANTAPVPQVTLAGNSLDPKRPLDSALFPNNARIVVALPADADQDICVEAFNQLHSMATAEPTWSPATFWDTTCRNSWSESPWGLRPDAWVIPAVSISEGSE